MSRNMQKTNFQLFIDVNNLKKKYIAEYLSVSNAFITQLSQGLRDIPNDKMALIKANQDWNISMFNESGFKPLDDLSDQVVMSREVFEQITKMTDTILSQQATIKELTISIQNLTSKI